MTRRNPLSEAATIEPIGGAWLAREYGINPVQQLRIESSLARSSATHSTGNYWKIHYKPIYRTEPTLAAHLEFMLKHERIHLEFLFRLFNSIPSDEIAQWIRRQPKGKSARRVGFLFEWLTGRQLDFPGVDNLTYIDALDEDLYLTASQFLRVPRWCVRDNLPGNRFFCPTVLLTESVVDAQNFDVRAGWQDLEDEFGPDLIARSAVWLTIKESRASFAIEHETDKVDRIRRFAAVLESEVGRSDTPLDEETITRLQRSIVGDRATRYGLRRSPVFVGESRGAFETVHYIAPSWNAAPGMLAGLAETEHRTRGRSPLVRATLLSFGFVYIHPLTDGNGRISRFLVNDILRRDGALPEPFVLPVSAVISAAIRDYDRALERFSRPLMLRYADAYRFGASKTYDDGMISNLEFSAYEDAEPVWRYPDLTDHVAYMHDVVRATIEQEMHKEAREMRAYRNARRAVNDLIEGPDQDLDRIVRSVKTQNWEISNKLKSEFPLLEDDVVAREMIAGVKKAFEQV
jgi:hypothetical protein